jgi:hypothetical protein
LVTKQGAVIGLTGIILAIAGLIIAILIPERGILLNIGVIASLILGALFFLCFLLEDTELPK